MPRAVVILPSTTYRATDFVEAAESLGVDLVVASEQPPPFDMGDRYLQIDCSNPEMAAAEVAGLGDEVPLDAVVAADDAGVMVAAIAGTQLGLVAITPEAAATTRDKLIMRRRLGATEVPQPRFAALRPGQDPSAAAIKLGFPLVVKPIDRSASQGVLRVDDPGGLGEAVERARGIAGADATLLLEEYMAGEEVAVEGLVRDGELTVLAVFDKPDTPIGPVFPETILVTPSRLPGLAQDECFRVATATLRALGIEHGPVHIELKVEPNRVRVIEVAARSIGGLCSRSLNFGLLGTTLETLILRNALRMDKPELRRETNASGVLMIPIPVCGTLDHIEGVEQTRALDGVTGVDITIPAGTEVRPPPEGDRYLGFVFARSSSAGSVETTLRKAAATIRPIIR